MRHGIWLRWSDGLKQIFLSASIPNPTDEPYGATADPLLIHSAVRSLCTIAFGTRRVIWGGHPAITPMMWAACENLGLNYADTVHLYQSRYFEDAFPEENARFGNVTYVPAMPSREESLQRMRDQMLDNEFEAGVFAGGKEGVIQECDLFIKRHPQAHVIILPSTGGASRILAERYPHQSAPVDDFFDYISYIARFIEVSAPVAGEQRDGSKKGD